MKHLLTLCLLILTLTAHAAGMVVTAPSDDDLHRMQAHRAVIEKSLSTDAQKAAYAKADGKLSVLHTLLSNEAFRPEQTYELQSMGIVLGDAFVLEQGFHWVIVNDKDGRDPALQYRDTSLLVFPLTMISRRIERGEKVNVFELYNGIAEQIKKMKPKASKL